MPHRGNNQKGRRAARGSSQTQTQTQVVSPDIEARLAEIQAQAGSLPSQPPLPCSQALASIISRVTESAPQPQPKPQPAAAATAAAVVASPSPDAPSEVLSDAEDRKEESSSIVLVPKPRQQQHDSPLDEPQRPPQLPHDDPPQQQAPLAAAASSSSNSASASAPLPCAAAMSLEEMIAQGKPWMQNPQIQANKVRLG